MPPKAKITKEMVINAAFEIARSEGERGINARTVAAKLGCSTQPVMYLFDKVEDIKKAVYARLDWYHTEFLMDVKEPENGMMLGIGLNYIRFAIQEPNLFRFLFESDLAVENSLMDMINSEELKPVIAAMQQETGMDWEHTRDVFTQIAVFTHGYASIIADNSLEYDEETAIAQLSRAYRGALLAVGEEINEQIV